MSMEIHRLLKLEDEGMSAQSIPVPEIPEATQLKPDLSVRGTAPLNLPAATMDALPFTQTSVEEALVMPRKPSEGKRGARKTEPTLEPAADYRRPGMGRRVAGLLLYPIIFGAAFVTFYGILNFPALTSQVKAWFIKPQDEQILQEDLSDYNNWISGYYFSVGNKDTLGANNDIDHDGLTNYEEYVLGTNPTLSDSAGTGISDGVKVIDGLNYWGSGPMTAVQQERVKKLDLNMINNRINYNSAITHSSSIIEHKIAFDQSRAAQLSIPKLNLQVPLIWSQDPADFETDLTKGVIHYPGTAMPGEQGTVYVSGHSSDYIWKHNDYKRVFAQINALQPGDDIFVNAYGTDGKLNNFRYKVTAKNVYKPDDQVQFIDNTAAKLNLSTCWPIGTAKDRYVVTAVLAPL